MVRRYELRLGRPFGRTLSQWCTRQRYRSGRAFGAGRVARARERTAFGRESGAGRGCGRAVDGAGRCRAQERPVQTRIPRPSAGMDDPLRRPRRRARRNREGQYSLLQRDGLIMSDIILHHYPPSPYSEKIRVAFGIKKLVWRSVEIPNMMPKPDLMPLTGGYRKTPVMQIGADIFCDTQIILRELDRRFPSPSLFPYGRGLPYALAFWSDRLFFMPSVGVVFAEVGHMVPEAFKEDRAKMSGGTFSTDALKAAAPFARDQWRAHAAFVEEHLTSGRPYLQGDNPTANDIHVYMNFWWIKQAIPNVAETLLKEFRLVRAWIERVAAIGHGKPA